MASLVVAGSPYTSYPGGVLALRAVDWLGPARGSLSTEVDARAITGDVVRDTQTVATSLQAAPITAFQEADDTLVIDLSTLPMEIGMTYRFWVSALIEGDWEPTDEASRRGATNLEHVFGCNLAWYGDSVFNLSDSDFASIVHKPRGRAHYTISLAGTVGDVVGDEVFHLRAYSRAGTTLEWLIDQIFLIPHVFSGVHGEWSASDFAFVGGQHQTFGAIELTDGADGGDDQGKFTWHPYPDESEVGSSGADGGGDYQRKSAYSGAEYMLRVVPDDFYYLVNSDPTPDEEALAHAYSVHGANYRAAHTIVSDGFSRTTSPGAGNEDWGVTPEGFGWWFPGGAQMEAFVNGSQGVLQRTAVSGSAWATLNRFLTFSGQVNAASVLGESFSFSGTVECSEPFFGTPGVGTDETYIRMMLSSVSTDRCWFIHLDAQTGVWALYMGNARTHFATVLSGAGVSNYKFSSDFDISSWFAFNSPVGFRILKERYRLRVRVWDATGVEPGTWDFDGFLPITSNTSGNFTGLILDYPYADDFQDAHNSVALSRVFPTMGMAWSDVIGTPTPWNTRWDDIEIAYDPLGSSAPVSAAIEQPEALKIDEIEVPYGAYQMVYWGTRDWTALSGGSPAYLDFSARVWNAAAAAELQRAEAPLWYFRSKHAGILRYAAMKKRLG